MKHEHSKRVEPGTPGAIESTIVPGLYLIPGGPCQACEAGNMYFMHKLDKGGLGFEAKVQRLESTRKYYRKYPYDGWQQRTGLDAVDLVHPSNPLAEIIAKETRAELLSGLTERELWVALRADEGYKPRDMAAMRGKDTSGADRWVKHSVKQKMQEKLAVMSAV